MANETKTPQSPAGRGVPDGWKPVPVESTEAMNMAAVKFANGDAVYKNVGPETLKIEESIYGEVYEAMLAASPPPPSVAELSDEEIDAVYHELMARRALFPPREFARAIVAAARGEKS